MLIPEFGNQNIPMLPIKAPVAPPIVSKGASVPPEVPLPKEIAQDKNFKTHNESTTCIGIVPVRRSVMLLYPTPSVRGAKKPITPTAIPPIAGHHAQ